VARAQAARPPPSERLHQWIQTPKRLNVARFCQTGIGGWDPELGCDGPKIDHPHIQSFSIPVGSFAIHPWIRTRQLCTARKGNFAIFCTKKEGYLGVCQATKRVDSTGERLYSSRLIDLVSMTHDCSSFGSSTAAPVQTGPFGGAPHQTNLFGCAPNRLAIPTQQTATSETESKSHELSICVHHYTVRAPCPKGQGISQENRESRFCTDLAVGEPMARRRYALSSCLMLF